MVGKGKMTQRFKGIITSQVTPFKDNGDLDEPRLRQLIDRQLAAGVHGFLIVGNCGEFTNLTDEERLRTVGTSVERVAGRVPIIAGIFHANTAQAVSLATGYRELGATACLLLPPYFIKPSLDGVVEHFRTVAAESGLPVVVYNNPARTGLDLTPAVMRRLYGIPGVIGLKDCTRDLAHLAQKIEESPGEFDILYGDDDLMFGALMLGAAGGILAAANLVPEMLVEMYREATGGDARRANAIQNRLLPMIRSWYTVNHPAPLKGAMAMIGWAAGPARKPLQPMTPEEAAEVRRTLGELGLLA